ncbi:MAG: hypothetical protein WBP11_12355 [Dokdonella sp.]
MSVLLEPIDAIARRLQRDVLMLSFCDVGANANLSDAGRDVQWREDATRQLIVDWLARNGIRSVRCFPWLSPGMLEYPYTGHLFIDVPFDAVDARYQQFVGFLEDANGQCVHAGVGFVVIPLDKATRAVHGGADA